MGNQEIHDIAIIDSSSTSTPKDDSEEGESCKKRRDNKRYNFTSKATFSQRSFLRNEFKNRRRNIRSKNVGNENLIKSENEQEVEEVQFEVIKVHNEEYDDVGMIEQCFKKSIFLRGLDKSIRRAIIHEMSLVKVTSGQLIFNQGDAGSYFYVMKSGKVKVLVNDKITKYLTKGEFFGESALLHQNPRIGTVIAETDCLMWVLKRVNFRKIVEQINKLNYEENKRFVNSIPFLESLEGYQKSLLTSSLIKESFEKNSTIVSKGQPSDCLYIIKTGEVVCLDKSKVVKVLHQGEYFGERGILVDTTRTMDVVAKTDCTCYSISTATLMNMMSAKYRSYLYLNLMKAAFKKSTYFSNFTSLEIDNVFKFFKAYNYTKGFVAFPKGYLKSSHIVVIIDGNVADSVTGMIVAGRGDILFEEDLYHDTKKRTECPLVPDPDVLFLEADAKEILRFLQIDSFVELITKYSIIHTLYSISFFKNLPRKKVAKISSLVHLENFEDEEFIFKEGEMGSKFYIVEQGCVSIVSSKGGVLRTLHNGDFFGEKGLLAKEPRSASAISKGGALLYSLKKNDFLNNIEENMKNFLMERLFLQDDSIELKDLVFMKDLVKDSFGNISSVKTMKKDYKYAIKAMSLSQIKEKRLYTNILLEKNILLQLDHPFIIKLVKTLKDKTNVYFLLEYVKGSNLFNTIREIGLLTKYQTQFYIASMLLVARYLHERKFIFRDIKPENIMVASNGYIKLINFKTAKKIVDRTSTLVGTPYYMAPEVVMGEGYSFQVDYWSIGVCCYEFFCGDLPFGASFEDPMNIYLSIMSSKIDFPKFCTDREFKSFIKGMLNKNLLSRLRDFNSIKNHPWFFGFDWDGLIAMDIEVPYLVRKNMLEEKAKENNLFIDYIGAIEQNRNLNDIDVYMEDEDFSYFYKNF